jgi:hypothetical protein
MCEVALQPPFPLSRFFSDFRPNRAAHLGASVQRHLRACGLSTELTLEDLLQFALGSAKSARLPRTHTALHLQVHSLPPAASTTRGTVRGNETFGPSGDSLETKRRNKQAQQQENTGHQTDKSSNEQGHRAKEPQDQHRAQHRAQRRLQHAGAPFSPLLAAAQFLPIPLRCCSLDNRMHAFQTVSQHSLTLHSSSSLAHAVACDSLLTSLAVVC